MGIAFLICICIVATSFLSGVFGMAGGITLMAILSLLLPVGSAFVIHGAAQFFSNSSRAWLLRQHIQWRIVAFYFIGWSLTLAAFSLLSYFPNKGVVLIAIGVVPWIGFALPRKIQPNIENPLSATFCGLFITAFQLFAGVSGPLLDYFYLRTKMTRHEIVGTKAITQAAGHFAKFVYYGFIVKGVGLSGLAFSPWWLLALAPLAWLGTRLGKLVLDRLTDHDFRKWARLLIYTLSALMAAKGIHLLATA